MSYSIKAPIHNKGGLVESASNVHTTILTIDDGTEGIGAGDATLQFVAGDLILENNTADKNTIAKLGDAAGVCAFQVADNADAVHFHVGSDGSTYMSTKTLTGSGITIADFNADARFIFVDLSSNTSTGSDDVDRTITSVLLSPTGGTSDIGLITTIVVVEHNDGTRDCIFKLTVNAFINPGDGTKGGQDHTFSNAGMGLTLVWSGTHWVDVSAGTV